MNYYRNTTEIEGIEPQSLWQLIGDSYVLVDDDQYIAVPAKGNEALFAPVPESNNQRP